MVALSASWADPSRHNHVNDYGATHDDPSDWDPEAICDFFAGKSVSLPTSATRTIAVEETRYFWFDVLLQDDLQPGVFGWSFSGQTLDIDKIDNMTAIFVDVDGGIDSPLVSTTDIAVNLTPDGAYTAGTHIILDGLSGDPSITVLLNGQPANPGMKWDWLPNGTSMILYRQVDLANANWQVIIP